MNTKVKGDKIKEGSIPMSALATEVKDKIENAGGGADMNLVYEAIAKPIPAINFPNIIPWGESSATKSFEEAGITDELLFNLFKFKALNMAIYSGNADIPNIRYNNDVFYEITNIDYYDNQIIINVRYSDPDTIPEGYMTQDGKILLSLSNKLYSVQFIV